MPANDNAVGGGGSDVGGSGGVGGGGVGAEHIDSSVWKIAGVAVLGSFIAQLDATIVNVSLSSLASDLGAGLGTIHWVTSGYLLALTLALPLNGWLVDRIGAKALYLWCFSAFTLSSALCATAWSAESLIAFRVFQGISGGLLAPMAQMMMARAAGRNMARVMGYGSVPILLAPILGPVIAGAILHYASWRWLFLVNVPFGALALALAFFLLPGDGGETRPRELDWAGLLLLSPGLVLFLYALDSAGGWRGFAVLAAAVALLAGFFTVARRKGGRALIDLRLFAGRVFRAAARVQFLANGVLFSGQMLIPVFLARACGLTPAEAGWRLTPLGLGMMCVYPAMGALTKRFGIRRVSAAGAALALLGTLPFVFLAAGGLNMVALAAALFVRGAGLGAVGLPSVAAAYASVARGDLPMANTTLNIVQRLGGPTLTTVCAIFLGWRLGATAVGTTTAGVTTGVTSGAIWPAYAWAFVLLGALHAVLLAAALRLPMRLEPAREGKNLSVTESS